MYSTGAVAIEIGRNLVRRTFLYDIILTMRKRIALRQWEKSGKLGPPPHLFKELTVKEYARRFSILTLVETGTYLGEMVHASRGEFRRIFSVELDRRLYGRAKEKFARFPHISIIHGDSGEVLPDILATITEPCLFWLDGHYSGGITAKGRSETPIMQELHHILNHSVEDHVVLIDDASLFAGWNGYPSLEELRDLVLRADREKVFEVRDDIIRIHKGYAQVATK